MNAQQLFQQGVIAIRDQNNIEVGRKLLMQSLQLNPQNDMAWLWLARASANRDQRLRCIERALALNPSNPHARRMREQLNQTSSKTSDNHLSSEALLKRAAHALEQGDVESALRWWLVILNVEPSHDTALRNAVQHLVKLKQDDKALELIVQAINSGATSPAIYLTGMELAKRTHDNNQLDRLYEDYLQLPAVDDQRIWPIIDQHAKENHLERALELSLLAMERYPKSQALLVQHGDLLERCGKKKEALFYYEQAAKLGARTEHGRIADEKLAKYAPVITDKERGSIILAWRETLGIGLFFFVLAFQDAGLNLFALGERWLGVGLSLLGGYLLVTATSSPQQKPIAAWMGGQVPPHREELVPSLDGSSIDVPTQLPIIPMALRIALGTTAIIMLVVAFGLCFSRALGLLANPIPPYIIPFEALFSSSAG